MKTISESKYLTLMRCAEALTAIDADSTDYRLLNLQRLARLIVRQEQKSKAKQKR